MTTEQDNGSGRITYTVKDLLAELKLMVQNIDSKLDAKAEKSVVENIEKRLSVLETTRAAELPYATEIVGEFRQLQKDHNHFRLDIASLQQNKKEKEAFNVLWIPILFNTFCTLALGIYGFFYIH